jgi:hypothetical protein
MAPNIIERHQVARGVCVWIYYNARVHVMREGRQIKFINHQEVNKEIISPFALSLMRAAFLWEPKGQICDDNCCLMARERERKHISLHAC